MSTAKGRTNVELREQFILAEGVSQSMTPFKSKPSPNSSVSSQSGAQQRSQSLTTSGPIIKVRERTAKSVAMGRPSYSAGTPDSAHGDDHGGFKLHDSNRKKTGYSDSGSRGGSRPSSRGPGSRPMSRTGSDVSLDSYDGTRTGAMRRTPSFTGRTKTPSSQTTTVQRSSSLRKGSAPVQSSTTTFNGSSTRIGSVTSRLYAPTLSSTLKEKGVRTKIPVMIGSSYHLDRGTLSGSVTNLDYLNAPLRSRTPSATSLSSNHSGSKIPILRPRTNSGSSNGGGTSALSQNKAGVSDTPTGLARKSGIVQPRRRL